MIGSRSDLFANKSHPFHHSTLYQFLPPSFSLSPSPSDYGVLNNWRRLYCIRLVCLMLSVLLQIHIHCVPGPVQNQVRNILWYAIPTKKTTDKKNRSSKFYLFSTVLYSHFGIVFVFSPVRIPNKRDAGCHLCVMDSCWRAMKIVVCAISSIIRHIVNRWANICNKTNEWRSTKKKRDQMENEH